MESQKTLHKVGMSEVIDRRRFLQRAAVTAASVPVIMTLTTTGASAAPCSAVADRDNGCACTLNSQCLAGSTCQNTGVAGGGPPGTCAICKTTGAGTSATTCLAVNNSGVPSPDNTCCSGQC